MQISTKFTHLKVFYKKTLPISIFGHIFALLILWDK
jgi:hypothetical protein